MEHPGSKVVRKSERLCRYPGSAPGARTVVVVRRSIVNSEIDLPGFLISLENQLDRRRRIKPGRGIAGGDKNRWRNLGGRPAQRAATEGVVLYGFYTY